MRLDVLGREHGADIVITGAQSVLARAPRADVANMQDVADEIDLMAARRRACHDLRELCRQLGVPTRHFLPLDADAALPLTDRRPLSTIH